MGVQLNIKAPKTAELARHLARELGKSVTETVHEALEEKRQRREAEIAERIRLVNELIDEVRRGMPDEWRRRSSAEIMESIYDDDQPDGFAR
jgi:hypothetical protein